MKKYTTNLAMILTLVLTFSVPSVFADQKEVIEALAEKSEKLEKEEEKAIERAQDAPEEDRDEARGIVLGLKEDVLAEFTTEEISQALSEAFIIEDTIEGMNLVLVNYTGKKDVIAVMEELLLLEIVEYAEPNYIAEPSFIPNDELYTDNQWNLSSENAPAHLADQISPDADIDAKEAWGRESSDGEQIIIAVIDAGVDYTHEDLIANMWDGSGGCKDVAGEAISGGCPFHGWDFVGNDNDPKTESNHHGTFVAGVFGAQTDNTKGIAGLSRYGKLKIMALRTNYSIFQTTKAIHFAQKNDAHVINASYYNGASSMIKKSAIEDFDGLFVVAAGNNASSNDEIKRYPCNYSLDNMICVGASSYEDTLVAYSNYGKESVDIAAPTAVTTTGNNNSYITFTGTSASAPHVAGAVGLVMSNFPELTASSVKERVLETADLVEALEDDIADGRRLSIGKALEGGPLAPQSIDEDAPILILNGANPLHLKTSETYSEYGAQASDQDRDFDERVIVDTSNLLMTIPGDYQIIYSATDPSGNTAQVERTVVITGENPDRGSVDPREVETNQHTLFRFYSENYRGHFYTTSRAERDILLNTNTNWAYEGQAYETASADNVDALPVYRFWSEKFNHHFYTQSEAEKTKLQRKDPNWLYEGSAYYAFEGEEGTNIPVYRFWSETYKGHFYTNSPSEKRELELHNDNWQYEGIAWYVKA